MLLASSPCRPYTNKKGLIFCNQIKWLNKVRFQLAIVRGRFNCASIEVHFQQHEIGTILKHCNRTTEYLDLRVNMKVAVNTHMHNHMHIKTDLL